MTQQTTATGWTAEVVSPTGCVYRVGEHATKADAKRAASAAHPALAQGDGWRAWVTGPRGSLTEASQRIGRGMLWTN